MGFSLSLYLSLSLAKALIVSFHETKFSEMCSDVSDPLPFIHCDCHPGWQLSVAAEPFLRSNIWELFLSYEHFLEYEFLRIFTKTPRSENQHLGDLDGDPCLIFFLASKWF